MSRVFARGPELRRAAFRSASRSAVPEGLAFGGTRDLAVQASQLHPQTPFQSLLQHRARYGGLAVAAAGSLALVLLSSQLEDVEDLLPPVVEQDPSAERIDDFYDLRSTSTLGSGQFGTVSLATNKTTGELVAVKRVPRSNVKEAHFREEAEAHRDVSNHPNVVGLKGVFADEECWYMVMELAAGGELYDRLTMEGVLLEDDDVRGVLRGAADALAHMHDRGIVHGDIKPENILLSTPVADGALDFATGSEEGASASTPAALVRRPLREMEQKVQGGELGRVLLADFGSSFRLTGPHSTGRQMVKAYTAAYSAPEVVLNACTVDGKADVWSLGVIAYVMCKGYHPFDPTSEASDDEIMKIVVTSEPDWDGLEPQAAQLIRKMLSKDPADRPSAREVLQNAWLQLPN